MRHQTGSRQVQYATKTKLKVWIQPLSLLCFRNVSFLRKHVCCQHFLVFGRVSVCMYVCKRRGEGQLLMLCWRFHSGGFGPRNAAWRRSQLRKGEAEKHMVHILEKAERNHSEGGGNNNGSMFCIILASEKEKDMWVQLCLVVFEHPASFSSSFSDLLFSLQLFVNCLTRQGRYSILNQSLSSTVSTLLQHQLLSSHPGFPLAQNKGNKGREEARRGRQWWRIQKQQEGRRQKCER